MTEYTLADFQEEIVQCRFEKSDTLTKYLARQNEPMAGLTRLRIERLDAMAAYLRRIQDFQAGKMVEEKPAEPAPASPPAPETQAPLEADGGLELPADDFDD